MKWFSNRIAIDLGTAGLRMASHGRGVVIDEPSVVAVTHNGEAGERVLCVGNEARQMVGKTPAKIRAIRPLRNGVVVNIDATCALLKHFIRKFVNGHRMARIEAVVCVPTGITPIEMHAVQESLQAAGVRRVIPVSAPVAGAIGAGLPVTEPTCNMVVDIGEGTTEVAVISLAGIVTSRCIKVAGEQLDASIQQYMRQHYNLLVGDRTAERIKTQLGNARPDPDNIERIDVKGRDLTSGIPKALRIDALEIHSAVADPLNTIIKTIQGTLEDIPPELSADVLERGMVMTGGGALLKNLRRRLQDEMNLPVSLPKDPIKTVVVGAAKLLDNSDGLQHLVGIQ